MFETKILGDAFKKLNPSFSAADFVDKAHYMVTCGLILIFGVILGAKQIFGEPISCMVPAEVPGSWSAYIHEYCFVTSTYTLNDGGDIMAWDEDHVGGDQKISVGYYQWIPYLLMLQAALFYAPHLFWRLFQETQTDIPFEHIVDDCVAGKDMPVSERDAKIKDVVDSLVTTHDFRQVKCKTKGLGTAGMTAYVALKLLNIANLFFQFHLLNWFIGRNSFTWGIETLKGIFGGNYQTNVFPRVSFCTFKHNVLGGNQDRSTQCLLMMNMLNEKVFILLYFWFMILFIASLLNLFCLLYRCFFRKKDTVNHYLQGQSNSKSFAYGDLGPDGVLLLRFVENSAGHLVASHLACALHNALQIDVARCDHDKESNDVLEHDEDKNINGEVPKKSDDLPEKSANKENDPLLNYSLA